ncbi:MAG: small ribosomal subunit Rsm22 family protein [Chlamydiota bacterium]
MFPEKLQENIDKCLKESELTHLGAAAQQLTERYRGPARTQFMETEGHRIAYLLTRMPATYAAIAKVFEELVERIPALSIHSFLDLGTGPGTGLWAVKEFFPQIVSHTLLEKDAALISLGKKLSEGKGRWIQCDAEKTQVFDSHDLVLLSYALGELKDPKEVALRAWHATEKILVMIEPGTPLGFERLRKIREILIAEGAHLVAPCPHARACPLKQNDWCHFSARLNRTSLHRQMKGGSLGYEDEKFFYLIFSKITSVIRCKGRILRHPQKHSGYVEMTVCKEEGIERKIFSRKDKEIYKWARKAEWGDEPICKF